VLPLCVAVPGLADRLDPMLLEASAQPLLSRHAPVTHTPLNCQVTAGDPLEDFVARHVEFVVESTASPLDLVSFEAMVTTAGAVHTCLAVDGLGLGGLEG
jgi:hypothetical protein